MPCQTEPMHSVYCQANSKVSSWSLIKKGHSDGLSAVTIAKQLGRSQHFVLRRAKLMGLSFPAWNKAGRPERKRLQP